MRAAVYRSFGGPIRVENGHPIPSVASCPDSVVLQVLATGVCRSDCHAWLGHDSDVRHHGLPFCPGHEVSGIILKMGERVLGGWKVGDRVAVPFILSCGTCEYCQGGGGDADGPAQPTVCRNQLQPGFTQWGAFAEYVLIPRADAHLQRLPNNVSHLQAAALGCRVSTAYRAIVQRGQLTKKPLSRRSLCVVGVGGVGLACCLIAQAVGCHCIVAVDSNPAALDKALQVGATHTVLSTPTDNENENDDVNIVAERVLEWTGGHGAGVVIDASGASSTCALAVACARRGGRVVCVGLPSNPTVPIPLGTIAARELNVVGSHGFDTHTLKELLHLVSSGKLDPGMLVERCVNLDEGARVLESMRHSSPLGIVMITHFAEPTTLRPPTQSSRL